MGPREQLEREIERLEGRLDGASDPRAIDELAIVRRGLASSGPRGPGIELPNLRIGFACKQRWEDMVGDDRVRACSGCDRPVFNLSEMTRAEAEAVLATRGLTPCVRFYRRPDGTVMTTDCPTGARPAPRRLVVVASSLAAAGAALGAAPSAMAAPSLAAGTADTEAAPTGAIEGTVADTQTGEQLAGVTVIVTSPQLSETRTTITDENGAYQVGQLPAGDYLVTFYYADITVERSGIQVGIDKTTPVFQKLNMAAGGGETITIQMGGIAIDSSYVHMGLPVSRTFGGVLGVEMGGIVANEKRPAVEWSVWGRLGVGVVSQRSDVIARRVTAPEAGATSTWEAAVAADLTFPVTRHGDLRVGVWGEARTSSEMIAGGELVLEGLPPHPYGSRIGGAGSLVLRAGANDRVVTGALGFGYVGSFPRSDPWIRWARHVVGARVVVSVNRAIDEPHDWSATLGLEVEPIGAVHALIDVVSGR